MNIKRQRTIDRLVGIPLCAILSVFARIRPKRIPTLPPRKILVILLSEMGSLMLTYPMFRQLQRRYPQAAIHALVFKKNREILDLLQVIPAENVLVLDDHGLGSFLGDCLRLLRSYRLLTFDMVIDCELFARASSILAYLSGAPLRAGFHPHTQEGLYRGSLINYPVLYNPYRHLSLQFLTLAAALESKSLPLGKDEEVSKLADMPTVIFSEEEVGQTIWQLHADFPMIAGKQLILVAPGGGLLPIRAWPLEYFCELSLSFISQGYAIGIVGMNSDRAIGEAIIAFCKSPHCVNLAGYTKTVRHLLALFHRSALLVTNDGGPGHFAALTMLPAIVLFGPETPLLYHSLAAVGYNFHAALPCSPCLTAYNHRDSPCDGDNQCLKQIKPGEVLAKAMEILHSKGIAGTKV